MSYSWTSGAYSWSVPGDRIFTTGRTIDGKIVVHIYEVDGTYLGWRNELGEIVPPISEDVTNAMLDRVLKNKDGK